MGLKKKKTKAHKMARKREIEAAEKLQESLAEVEATRSLATAVANDELFVLDTSGDARKHRNVLKHVELHKKKNRRKGLSELEEKQVQRLMEKHDTKQLQAIAQKGAKRMASGILGSRKHLYAKTKVGFDLWKGEEKELKEQKQKQIERIEKAEAADEEAKKEEQSAKEKKLNASISSTDTNKNKKKQKLENNAFVKADEKKIESTVEGSEEKIEIATKEEEKDAKVSNESDEKQSKEKKKAKKKNTAADSEEATEAEVANVRIGNNPVAGIRREHGTTKALSLAALDKQNELKRIHTSSQKVSKKILSKKIAVDVAKAGQSYHPDPAAHQRLIEQAVEIELRREAAIEEKNKPVCAGLSEETKAVMVNGSDTDSSDDDEEGDDEDGGGDIEKKRLKRDKLTRTQRNKQKRHRLLMKTEREAKEEKKRMNKIAQAPRLKKELERKEREEKRIREEKQKIIDEKLKQPKGVNIEQTLSKENPITAPTVPLTLDASSSDPNDAGGVSSSTTTAALRTLRPRGSLVMERMLSWRQRGHKHFAKAIVTGEKMKVRKRRVNMKGARNSQWVGDDFIIKG